ncbi:hypothetical protein J5X84_25570 [Streptosporangiaceae bacterium NEAU-GS5]|nr:hypothetical protein [Streptosporangiaceae bacterium NEAU-GS5]
MRKYLPVWGLFCTAPLVAEFLLGDFPITFVVSLALLAPLYGGAAVLIRETARRTGRGWPTMVLLGLAYGVFEEGILTQSLFNPDYAGAHLLERGFIPALGIALPWTLFVLTLHTVWSVGVPIAMLEELAGERRTTPWLGRVGLIVTSVLFTAGSIAIFFGSYADGKFMAPWPRLVAVLVVVAALIVAAFKVPQPRSRTGAAPRPWAPFALTLALGAVFMVAFTEASAVVTVAGFLVLFAVAAVATVVWSGRPGWDGRHRVALAGGALLTYAWHGFTMTSLVPSTPLIDLVSHILFAAGAVALLGSAYRRATPAKVPELV